MREPVAGELVLGIDIGTSSSKGVLCELDGAVVATATRPHQISLPFPGWAEQSSDIWWDDFVALSRELCVAAGSARIAAVGVSGMGPCLLPADSDGVALRPALLYGIDTRASHEVLELTERLGAEAILERGGSALSSQAVGPKFLWLRRHEPTTWGKTRRFFMPSSYLIYRLTGEYVLDHHSASQCDPMYDLRSDDWARDWAEAVAPGVELPRLLWSDQVVGPLTQRAAVTTGLPPGTLVTAGTIDAWAEAASVGVAQTGDTMLMYGSTMFVVEVVDREHATPDRTLWLTAGIESESRTLAAGTATAGAITEWFRRITGRSFDRLTEQAATVAPGSRGLLVLPYFAGERTPIYDPDARGMIVGLDLTHTPAELYRAILEGTALGIRHVLEAFASASSPPTRIAAVGGGTIGGLWTQIVSDVTGVPQEIPAITIGAAYGDALLAARACGLADSTSVWNRAVEVLEPRQDAHESYSQLYPLFRDAYHATAPTMHALVGRETTRRSVVSVGRSDA